MKLLLLLLPFCALGMSIPEGHPKHGLMSSEAKVKLQKILGMDPEMRRARLERIAEKIAQRHGQTPAFIATQEIPSVKLETPFENAPVSIDKLNEQLGVNKYLFQGDMHLTEEQLDSLEREVDGNGRSKRQAVTFANKWTNGTVYFYFDNDINERKKTVTREAHQYIQSRSCVSFVESRTATNRVRVFNGNGCYSSVGMSGGEQSLSLGDTCELVSTAAHEFAHALGFDHTQSRSDRNTFITLNDSNIETGDELNFELFTANQNILYVPYEYGSMMHYAAVSSAKVKNTLTMVPKDMRYLYTMGSSHISFYDIKMINKHYGCDAKCPSQNAPQCKNGGYPNPRDCSKCNCPAGYGGVLCDEKPSGCGETFTATSVWQNEVIEIGDKTDNQNIREDFSKCNHWITAPKGKKIEVQITQLFNGQCNYGCPFNGIEIKTENNSQITSPVICCSEFTNQVFTSFLNPTPIITFNRYYFSRFNIAFRYVDGSSPQPQPAVTTKAPNPTTSASSCVDQSTQCARLAQIYGCDAFSDEMKEQYCPKSCGLCGAKPTTTTKAPTTPPCADKNPSECTRLVQFFGCNRFSDVLKKQHCPKSCGYC